VKKYIVKGDRTPFFTIPERDLEPVT
jgi:hypothetical protein